MGTGSSEKDKDYSHSESESYSTQSPPTYAPDSDQTKTSSQGSSISGDGGLHIVPQHAHAHLTASGIQMLGVDAVQAAGGKAKEADGPTKEACAEAENDTAEERPGDAGGGIASYPKRLFGSVISSAVKHIHDIDKAPVEQGNQATMMSNIGHIKLKPDPATILSTGGLSEGKSNVRDLEAAATSKENKGRPGLLSNYLRLMHLDRKGSDRSRDNSAPSTPLSRSAKRPQGRAGQRYGGADSDRQWHRAPARTPGSPAVRRTKDDSWQDMDDDQNVARSSSNGMFSGLRRRRGHSRQSQRRSTRPSMGNRSPLQEEPVRELAGRRASGFFANMKKSGKGSSPVSPIGTPLANTPGVPFRHLSEALPWVNSQRQLASAGGTPIAQTRRPSISSLTGDVSTVPGVSIDTTPINDTLGEVQAMASNPSLAQFRGAMGERQNIEHAIDLLLLHQRFLVLMAKAMMMYGSPLHYLEDNLSRLAHLLDLEMTASTVPGLILLSFEDSITHTSETKIIRCSNGWDMHRLDQTNHLLRRVVHSKMEVMDAVKELEKIMTAPPIYAWYWQVLNWGVISWSLCLVCFGGSWTDSGISFALGLVAGFMNLAAGKYSGYTNFFEVSVSILSGLLAAALSEWSCFGATALSATVVLLPGLVMTTGVIELSSRHMMAGTVRIFYALLLAFILAYGLLIGAEIYNKIAGNQVQSNAMLDLTKCNSLTKWSWFGTFPLGIISISILVNIHWRHWFTVTTIAGMTYGLFWLFKFQLGLDDLATVVASFALGLVSNTWSKITGQTAYMILLPGEMFLVPGSVGVRGFSSLLSKESGQGMQLAMQMMTTCLGIMMGLFASTFLVYPRGKQRSAMLTV
ncbi:DUF1212-domain-containing protein [Martensiomyces pterosporus]|nr:DUF1212-domain-containing protein [Martensiomyces pterosporus]